MNGFRITHRFGLVSLLCVLAAAFASGCARLPSAGGGASGGAAATGVGPGWSNRMEDRRIGMERATRGSNVEITRTADNQLKVVVPSDIAFDPNGFALKPGLRSMLDRFSGLLAGDRNVQLTVVGHTDTSGGDAVNNPLSLDRAQSVRDYLVGRGVSATQIRTVGRGAREPIADNGTEAGRARNRRVEIFLGEPGSAG
jgi:outer membrane protein OmpA-like peptidoglycan-associated protein